MGFCRQEYSTCHFLLQGIFLTQGSNLCLLHWQTDSLPLSHQRGFPINVSTPSFLPHLRLLSSWVPVNFCLRYYFLCPFQSCPLSSSYTNMKNTWSNLLNPYSLLKRIFRRKRILLVSALTDSESLFTTKQNWMWGLLRLWLNALNLRRGMWWG